MTRPELVAFRQAAAAIRAELHFGKLDGSWDLTRASDLVRDLGDACDTLVFALQKVVGADVVGDPEPFGALADCIASAMERERDAAARQAREDYEPAAWSPTLEKFV